MDAWMWLGLVAVVVVATPYRFIHSLLKPRRYAGKVVIVTGASEGIGYELALAFFKEGAKVAIVARTKSKLEAAKSSFKD